MPNDPHAAALTAINEVMLTVKQYIAEDPVVSANGEWRSLAYEAIDVLASLYMAMQTDEEPPDAA